MRVAIFFGAHIRAIRKVARSWPPPRYSSFLLFHAPLYASPSCRNYASNSTRNIFFPHELLINAIFNRLKVKSAKFIKSSCKHWISLSKEKNFHDFLNVVGGEKSLRFLLFTLSGSSLKTSPFLDPLLITFINFFHFHCLRPTSLFLQYHSLPLFFFSFLFSSFNYSTHLSPSFFLSRKSATKYEIYTHARAKRTQWQLRNGCV